MRMLQEKGLIAPFSYKLHNVFVITELGKRAIQSAMRKNLKDDETA